MSCIRSNVTISSIITKTIYDPKNKGTRISDVDGFILLDLFNLDHLPTRYSISTLLNEKGYISHLSIKTLIHGNNLHTNIDIQVPIKNKCSFILILDLLLDQKTNGYLENLSKTYTASGRFFVKINNVQSFCKKSIETKSLLDFVKNYSNKRKKKEKII